MGQVTVYLDNETEAKALAGAWPDLPSAERIRKSRAMDVSRGRV